MRITRYLWSLMARSTTMQHYGTSLFRVGTFSARIIRTPKSSCTAMRNGVSISLHGLMECLRLLFMTRCATDFYSPVIALEKSHYIILQGQVFSRLQAN